MPTSERDGNEKKIPIHIDADLADLIPGYLEGRLKDADTIQMELAARNFERIRILAHDMRGSGTAYGFEMITRIGRSMEEAALEKNQARIQKGIDDLAFYLGAIEIVEDGG